VTVTPKGRPDAEDDAKAVIELLLKHGADQRRIGGPSNPKTTALEVAQQQNWGEPILKLLRP
jgi:hypothetical protein